MEITFDRKTITLEKEMTAYDDLAITFSQVLQQKCIPYVFVSGYVAILFGRSRVSEDIDMLVEHLSFKEFCSFWNVVCSEFYCHNTSDVQSAYDDYLEEQLAIRFSQKDVVIPNVEFKWAGTEQQKRALQDRLCVQLSKKPLSISALELQIAYKLYLGSDKDVEDARYLFELFRKHLDLHKLQNEIQELGLPLPTAKKNLGW